MSSSRGAGRWQGRFSKTSGCVVVRLPERFGIRLAATLERISRIAGDLPGRAIGRSGTHRAEAVSTGWTFRDGCWEESRCRETAKASSRGCQPMVIGNHHSTAAKRRQRGKVHRWCTVSKRSLRSKLMACGSRNRTYSSSNVVVL
jgi:hypothetical protein